MQNFIIILISILLWFLGAMVGNGLGHWIERDAWRTTTIERGLAEYCPTTGDWAWKEECDNNND